MPEKLETSGKTRKERASKLREAGKSQVRDNYIPVDEDDLKHTIEIKADNKPTKEEIEKIIKQGTKKPKTTIKGKVAIKKATGKLATPTKGGKKHSTKKMGHKPASSKKFTPPKISLKKPEDGYELIITEKPQAAQKIAMALADNGKLSKKSTPGKVTYYEVDREGHRIVVGCAVGHLFTLQQVKQTNSGYSIPTFEVQWVPNSYVNSKQTHFSKKYYDVLAKLVKGASSLTVATDYDVEGEVIGWNVVRFLAGQKDASRMKFSTLTNTELNNAYDKKYKTIDWGQAIAGETRHYLDWFYGINLSRALMDAIKTTGSFKIMSIGRVQGPALHLIVDKEKEIQKFKSETYWQIFATIIDPKTLKEIELKHNKDIFDKKLLPEFEKFKGKTSNVTTTKSEQVLPPNPPFNLTNLQTEAYKLHGITPSRTLQLAQSLYLSGLISYPRTSSQKLPDSIAYKTILNKIAKQFQAESLIKREKPVEGSKSDPAHPSIYPTAENQDTVISDQEQKIYNLIAKRFLALFCEDAIIDNKTIKAKVEDKIFSTRGTSIRKKAWLSIYPVKMEEKSIPDIEGELPIEQIRTEEKETQPPKRFSPASILSQLEKRNLGTKATRANILETLYDRGYIKEKSIEASPLGISLIDTMEKYSPIIIDEKLTREFEEDMEKIQTAKSGLLEKEKAMIERAKDTITKIISQFYKNEKSIGRELLEATQNLRAQEKKDNTLDFVCPKCGKGKLAITYSPRNKKHFIACNAYPKCKNTFSLPPGNVKKLDKKCQECEFPMMMRLMAGKRPWIFCFNPNCPSRQDKEVGTKKNKTE